MPVAVMLMIILLAGCGKSSNTENTDQKQQGGNEASSNKDGSSPDKEDHVMIKVSSMQCGTCKKNIEKALMKTDGVIDAKVDKNEKVAHVNYDKSKTDVSKIETAITLAGYDANDKKADPKAYEELDDCCKLPKDRKDKSDH